MKALIKFIILTVLASIAIVSCSNSSKMESDEIYEVSMTNMPDEEYALVAEYSDHKVVNQSTVPFTPPVIGNFIATTKTSTINDDENHKFIRTAAMKFKVKDVVSATSAIEDVIIRNKGFIIRSAITNSESTSAGLEISKDSTLFIIDHNLVGNLSLKVPKDLLDTTLREIAPLAIHIDYRTVEAEDITVKLLSDKLEQERMAKKQKRIGNAIGSRSGKLEDAMDAEDRLDLALQKADQAYLSAFSLNERMAYSVINISVYQDPITEKRMKYTPSYEPGFGARAKDGLSGGWNFICEIILFFINIWPITLTLLAILIFIYRIFVKKRRDRKTN